MMTRYENVVPDHIIQAGDCDWRVKSTVYTILDQVLYPVKHSFDRC